TVPQGPGVRIERLIGVFHKVARQGLQPVASISLVRAIRQKASVLGISDEQQAEENDHRLVVRRVQGGLLLSSRQSCNVHPFRYSQREIAHNIAIDALW